jgi:hypothetical protein
MLLGCRADHFEPSDLPVLVAYAKAVIAEKAARLHVHHAADRLDRARDLQAGQDAI